ncbi:uncharacterized protein isoform X2 [Rhodnius prolixus]|uniref:uncharacterized protein isoform X2 n=1 Tax=Rhodnius prolixus TaxID=13249 RepID=UPI003D18F6CD
MVTGKGSRENVKTIRPSFPAFLIDEVRSSQNKYFLYNCVKGNWSSRHNLTRWQIMYGNMNSTWTNTVRLESLAGTSVIERSKG